MKIWETTSNIEIQFSCVCGDLVEVRARPGSATEMAFTEEKIRNLVPFPDELRFSNWSDVDSDGWSYARIRRVYTWTVQFEVDATWVADGFDLDDDRAERMLANDLKYAYGHELGAKVLTAPNPVAIKKEQGYT